MTINMSTTQKNCIQEAMDFLFDEKNSLGGIYAIQAGAGSGKTTTMLEIISQMLKKNIPEEQIKMFSFTRASAMDIRIRILDNIYNDKDRKNYPYVDTIHSFSNSLLKQLQPILSTISEPDTNYKFNNKESKGKILRETLSSFLVYTDRNKSEEFISIMRNSMIIQALFKNEIEDIQIDSLKNIHLKDKIMVQKGRGRDIEAKTENIIISMISALQDIAKFTTDNSIRDLYVGKYLIFDECQDLDISQVFMIYALLNLGCRIIVIGDPLQSLYRFRIGIGSILFDNNMQQLISNIFNFNYKKSSYELFVNYRSEKSIIYIQSILPKYFHDIFLHYIDGMKKHLLNKNKNTQLIDKMTTECKGIISEDEINSRLNTIKEENFHTNNISLIETFQHKPLKEKKDIHNSEYDIDIVEFDINSDEPDDYMLDNENIIKSKNIIKYDGKIILNNGFATEKYFLNKELKTVSFKEIQKKSLDEVFNPHLRKAMENMFINVANGYSAAILMSQWAENSDIVNINNFVRDPLVEKMKKSGNILMANKISKINILMNNGLLRPLSSSHVFPFYSNGSYNKTIGIPLSSICLMAVISSFMNDKIYLENKWTSVHTPNQIFSYDQRSRGEKLMDSTGDFFTKHINETIRFIQEYTKKQMHPEQINIIKTCVTDFMNAVYNRFLTACYHKAGKKSVIYTFMNALQITQNKGYNPDDLSIILNQFLFSIQNVSIFKEYTMDETVHIRDKLYDSGVIFDYPVGYAEDYSFNLRVNKILQYMQCHQDDDDRSIIESDVKMINNGLFGLDKFTGEMLGHLMKTIMTVTESHKEEIGVAIRAMHVNNNNNMKRDVYKKIVSTVMNLLNSGFYPNQGNNIGNLFKKYVDPIETGEVIEDSDSNTITLSTIHGSKGLEWDHVMVFIPIEKNKRKRHSVENESHIYNYVGETFDNLNKMYVALSRAKVQLDLITNDYHDTVFENKIKDGKWGIPYPEWLFGRIIYELFYKIRGKDQINKISPLITKNEVIKINRNVILTTSSSEMEKSSCKNSLLRVTKLPLSSVSLNPKPSFENSFHKLMASICAYMANIVIDTNNRESSIEENIAYKIACFYNMKHTDLEKELDDWAADTELNNYATIWGKTIAPPKRRGTTITDLGKKMRPDEEIAIGKYYGRVVVENLKNMIKVMYGTDFDMFEKLKSINERNDYKNIWIEKEIRRFYQESRINIKGYVDLAVILDDKIFVYDFKGVVIDMENKDQQLNYTEIASIEWSKGIRQIHGYAESIRTNNINNYDTHLCLILYASPYVSPKFICGKENELPVPDIPSNDYGDIDKNRRSGSIATMGMTFDDDTFDEMIELSKQIDSFKKTDITWDDTKTCDINEYDDHDQDIILCQKCDNKSSCGYFGKKTFENFNEEK